MKRQPKRIHALVSHRCVKELHEIQEQYKIALQKLYKWKDLEGIFYLRVLMETGMRSNDVYDLRPSEITNRKIIKKDQKTNRIENYPRISKRTEHIGKILLANRNYFFTRSHNSYKMKIRRCFTDPTMHHIYFRHYRSDMITIINKKKGNRKGMAAC